MAAKRKKGMGSGIVIYRYGQNIKTLQYKLSKKCTNNQAEQLATQKALEYIDNTQIADKKLQYTRIARQHWTCQKQPNTHKYNRRNQTAMVRDEESGMADHTPVGEGARGYKRQ